MGQPILTIRLDDVGFVFEGALPAALPALLVQGSSMSPSAPWCRSGSGSRPKIERLLTLGAEHRRAP